MSSPKPQKMRHARQRTALQILRRVWQLAGPLRHQVAAGVAWRFAQALALGMSIGVAVSVISDLAQGRVIDLTWGAQVIGLMGVSLLGQMGFGYLSFRASWLSSYEVAGNLRLRLLARLRQLPMGFHNKRHGGDTVTALTTDMQMLENFFADGLPSIAQALGLPIAVFLVLLSQDWRIALVAATSVVLAIPVFVATSRHLARMGITRQDLQAEAGSRVIDFIRGLAVLRAFNQVQHGQDALRRAIEDLRDISATMVARLTLPMAAFGLVVMMGLPLVMWIIGLRAEDGGMEGSTTLTVLILIYAMYAPLLRLLDVMEVLRMADVALIRLDRILSAPVLPQHPEQQVDGFDVRFRGVSFGYTAQTPVLDELSFTVPERSMTAIVGPSGSGKSTTLNLLNRFWDCDHGEITIGGVNLTHIGEAGLSDLVSMVFQDVYLFSGTIRENIAMGKLDASTEEIEAAADAAQAHTFISRLPKGYDTQVGEGGSALSGGERQRIAIARAILKDAPIVLMDEVTSAMDPSNERAIQTALSHLVQGRTLIVVAHKLSTVQSADQILVLDKGQIVERGRHASLLKQEGLYARFWDHRAKAASWQLGS